MERPTTVAQISKIIKHFIFHAVLSGETEFSSVVAKQLTHLLWKANTSYVIFTYKNNVRKCRISFSISPFKFNLEFLHIFKTNVGAI